MLTVYQLGRFVIQICFLFIYTLNITDSETTCANTTSCIAGIAITLFIEQVNVGGITGTDTCIALVGLLMYSVLCVPLNTFHHTVDYTVCYRYECKMLQ